MGKEFLKIKESSEAKKIIGDLFDKYYTSESEVVFLVIVIIVFYSLILKVKLIFRLLTEHLKMVML